MKIKKVIKELEKVEFNSLKIGDTFMFCYVDMICIKTHNHNYIYLENEWKSNNVTFPSSASVIKLNSTLHVETQ